MAKQRKAALRPFDPSLNLGPLDEITGFLLRRASVFDFSNLRRAMEDDSITALRYCVLELIAANQGLRQVQLAQFLGLSEPAISGVLDFWEKQACVARERDPSDKRSYCLVLTAHGQEQVAELRARAKTADERLTSPLDAHETAQLHSFLQRICDREK